MSVRPPSKAHPRAVELLVNGAHDLLVSTGSATAAAFLSDWPAQSSAHRQLSPRELPVLDWLETVKRAAAPATRSLVDRLVGVARTLTWAQTYGPDDFGPSFLARYGWTELIGLRGPVASSRIAAGFLLLGPGIEYPLHSHDAEELYLSLSGTARWKYDEGNWIRREPGTIIHHRSGTPHGMRTEREPLLALYVWRGGNLAQKSRIC
ncbi:MAG: dimethylsulfonioproprionate lyase family protein [Betaproteobacteria bacterium]